MADANWSNLLHTALEEWSAGRLERAGRSFTRVLEDCQIPEMLVWRAFVHNQLALLSQESGDWEEARLHWQAARESWQESSLSASSPELRATLAWYLDLLEHHQFHPRARELKQLIDRGLPPLLDPWQGGATLATAPLARTTPLAKTELNQPSYAPMGGQTVSLERKSSVTGSWTDLISQALELSARSNFARALHLFDQARHQVVDRRVTHPHLVAMVYCAESIGAFIAGNYPQAEKAREQASEIWRSPKSGDEDLQSFAQALSAGGQETAAVLFMTRVSQNQNPLLDPWKDLQSGIAQGEWKGPEVLDWLAGLEAALSRYARGNLGECQRLLDNLALQLEPDPSKEALLGQLQALIAQAQGDEKESRVFFNRARLSWKNAHSMGPELRLLEQNRLETVAQAMRAGHLLDPFEAPLPSQLGGDISPGRALPKVPENTEREPIAIPATAPSHRLVWLLALILLALGLTAWKLASQSGPPGSTPTPHARIVKSPPGRTRH